MPKTSDPQTTPSITEQMWLSAEKENKELREIIRLYVDPFQVKPEHEEIVEECANEE